METAPAGERGVSRTYDEARKTAINALQNLCRSLKDQLSFPLKYRKTSQAQAAPYERAYAKWVRSGGTGAHPFPT
jgi:hypothetical protein